MTARTRSIQAKILTSSPYRRTVPTPIGPFTLCSDGASITAFLPAPGDLSERDLPLFDRAQEQLEAYFAGERRAFDLPLSPSGTPFQIAVWQALGRVEYGRTASYGEIAAAIGNPRAMRAVGGAVGSNPIPVIIPCHRIICSDGSIGGYGLGIDAKRVLMRIEGIGL